MLTFRLKDILNLQRTNMKNSGWMMKRIEGKAIANYWHTLPWYKKIFRMRFWKGLFQKEIKGIQRKI